MKPCVLLIDNHDSFTHNLAQLLDQSGLCKWSICSAEAINYPLIDEADKLIFSPGPGIPSERPEMFEILTQYASSKSILGVCLGHQAIVEYFGGKLKNLSHVVHGIRQEMIVSQPADELFSGMPYSFYAGLYHSWAADESSLPEVLRITAVNNDGLVMAVSHHSFDVRGVQFHPESYMTDLGRQIINNWLSI